MGFSFCDAKVLNPRPKRRIHREIYFILEWSIFGTLPDIASSSRLGADNQEDSMAKDEHNKAAEHHEHAAKAHRSAAEHHGKGDHAKGKEHATSAKQHSQTAHQQSDAAHSKSQQQK
jgi:hypothetical protein